MANQWREMARQMIDGDKYSKKSDPLSLRHHRTGPLAYRRHHAVCRYVKKSDLLSLSDEMAQLHHVIGQSQEQVCLPAPRPPTLHPTAQGLPYNGPSPHPTNTRSAPELAECMFSCAVRLQFPVKDIPPKI
jgi:hypothetical protein